MTTKKQKIICVLGPTAVGKTNLAAHIYDRLPVDIISVDSTLVYRGMDIGTAKPSPAELKQTPHRMIDIVEPSVAFSVGHFCELARSNIDEILAGDRTPLLVGGTMLYFKQLLFGMTELPVTPPDLRQQVQAEANKIGWPAMHAQLKQFDPMAFNRIHPHDKQRIGRAIEIYRLTGVALSTLQQQQTAQLPYDVITVVVEPQERALLHQRIADRLQQMFAQGFIEEVQQFYLKSDIHPDLPAMRAVGYRQVWAYLAGEIDYHTCQQQALYATRQLAKRQLTWLRRWPDAARFYMEVVEKDLRPMLSYLEQQLDR